jgi:hypothetical protein
VYHPNQRRNVVVSDVALVWTRVYSNALSAKGLTILCKLKQVWQVSTPCIAQQGYFVDVYA